MKYLEDQQYKRSKRHGGRSLRSGLLALWGLGAIGVGPALADMTALNQPGLWPPIVQTAQPPLPGLGQPQAHVPQVTTQLVLRLGERRVYLYRGTTVVVSYPVAIGRDGWETPTGNFQVIQKTVDPVWQHPFNGTVVPAGKTNPLGVRWIGFWTNGDNAIGFHGTPNPELIGQAVSHGCVRMRNEDIVDLFDRVSEGTAVRVEP